MPTCGVTSSSEALTPAPSRGARHRKAAETGCHNIVLRISLFVSTYMSDMEHSDPRGTGTDALDVTGSLSPMSAHLRGRNTAISQPNKYLLLQWISSA